MAKGYSEVFTSVFAEKGERVVSNKIDGVRPYLRATLKDGLKEAYERNVHNKDLLGLSEVKLFEIGVVWKSGKETYMLGTAEKSGIKEGEIVPVEANQYASDDGVLRITVADTGAGLSSAAYGGGDGVGLSNIRSRLAALHRGRARLTLGRNVPHGVVAAIDVPLRIDAGGVTNGDCERGSQTGAHLRSLNAVA